MQRRHGDFTVEISCIGPCSTYNISKVLQPHMTLPPLLLYLVTLNLYYGYSLGDAQAPFYSFWCIFWFFLNTKTRLYRIYSRWGTSPCQMLTRLFKSIFRPNINHNCLSNKTWNKARTHMPGKMKSWTEFEPLGHRIFHPWYPSNLVGILYQAHILADGN